MFKIKSLNRDSISDDDAPIIRKEAQEENALLKYNNALKLQHSGNYEEAQSLLQSLLDEDIPEIENRGGLPKTMSTLKYSCYLNIGTIASNIGHKQKALDNFVHASDLDKTDVTLWFKIGSLALELDHFKQAAYALSQGLECNKNHWPSLDKLITLLYALRDTVSCLHYISRGLQLDPEYVRGLMLRKRIYENNPGTQDYYQLFNPDYIYDPPLNTEFDEIEGKELEKESNVIYQRIRVLEIELEPKPLPVLPLSKPLQEFTWLALGQSIVHMHNYIAENKLSFISRITLLENMNSTEMNEANTIIEETETIKTDENLEANNNEENMFIDDQNNIHTEKDKMNDVDNKEQESDVASEIPELASDDTETEVEKEDKQLNKDYEICNEEDNIFSAQTSKSNSQEDPEISADLQEDETEQRRSESDNAEQKDGSNTKTDNIDKNTNKLGNVGEKIKSKSTNRRRRNSLSFLQPWAWHSKRKSSRKMSKNDKDDTIEGTLRRIIPNNILPNGLKSDRCKQLVALQQEDSLSTMDLYKLFVEEQERVCDSPPPITVDKSESIKYFGSQQETEDVENFWKFNWERCDIIALLEKYVITLATMWEFSWPVALKSVYINAYEMYREHFDHPQVFCDAVEFKILRTDVELTLLYSELIFDCVQDNISKGLNLDNIKQLPCSSLSTMEFICTRKTDWGADYLKVCLRLYWLKANIYMVENKNDLAIRALNSVIYYITTLVENNNDYYLYLPNCAYNSLITLHNTQKVLLSLEMLQKLECVESLFENKCYTDVIKILQETFKLKSLPRCKSKIDRPVQIVMLLHALWLTNRIDCFLWSEICLNESLPMYLKTHAQPDSFEHKRWSLVVVKCLVLMEACITEENIIILDYAKETQTRLVENLTSVICHQINTKSMDNISKMPLECVKSWILLHYILQREEHRIQAKRRMKHCRNSDDSDDEQKTVTPTKFDDSEEEEDRDIPPSISILFSAHEFLGRRGWCLESSGELLLFLVDVILYRLNAPIFEGIREKIEIYLEQAFFCLYQHPSKKNKVSRHLADHNVDPLSLTWDRAQQLYEFYQPKALPEFDSYRYSSISNEMEQLLLRILALVPPEHDPQSLVSRVTEFINGQIDTMPDPINFPHKVCAMYYLLGDYYLKLHDPAKGLKYFVLDLCINPTRLDTWADMALAMASQLETKLNHCETFRSEAVFLDKARSAQICFKQALNLSNGHSMLWIEYGNFVYMGHSFCSRLLKGDTDTLSMEKFEALESQKEAMLDTAMECFTAANISWQVADPGEHDERWLHHYMLGKIAEKKKQDPSVYLEHYSKAGKLLFENKATYPLKINYGTPQHLSVEALEIHYRVHASILKYLELHEDKPITRSVGKVFQKYLKENDNGLFSKPPSKSDVQENILKRPASDIDMATIKRRRLSELTVFEDVANALEDIIAQVEHIKHIGEEKKDLNDDVVMIIDSDEDAAAKSKEGISGMSTPSTDSDIIKTPRIRVKNAQEIMDDMMKKCMANQPEYKSETETDAENENEKSCETVKPTVTEIPQKQMDLASSPSRRGSTTSTAATTTTTSTSDSSDSSSSDESSDSSSSDSESSETESSKQSNISGKKTDDSPMTIEEIKKLIDQCLLSLEQCISRFSQNYKALYRLTHFYLHNKMYRNLSKCRQLMLTEYRCVDSSVVTGLFSDRKNSNFFNGVWRIPTSEIDRPGSFAAHMSRCVQLLMQVLRDSDDHKTLLDLCLLLRRTPDPDKIYIRDLERQQLSDQALSICIQSLRGMIKKIVTGKKIFTDLDAQPNQETDVNVKLMLDIYRAYLKVQKHLVHKESVFSGLLIDAYKNCVQNKIPEGANILELAIKYCQQRKATTRLVTQQSTTSSPTTKQTPFAPQIIPSSSIAQALPVQTHRKTGRGLPSRPRGRPPNINKHLSGIKASKMMKDHNYFSATNPFAWQNVLYPSAIDPKFAFNFMVSKYQEELMRQYSLGQSSLLTNPFALSSMMPSNVLNNPSTSSIGSDINKDTLKPKVTPTSKITEAPKIKPTEKKEMKQTDTSVRYSKEGNKPYYAETSKDYSSDISIFKDRPGISITPIHQTTATASTSKQLNPLTVSANSTKTLQQKLAERQKQNPAAQQKPSSTKTSAKHDSGTEMFNPFQSYTQKNISFAKPSIPLPPVPHSSKLLQASSSKIQTTSYKNLAKSIPSSLTIMKSQPQNIMSGLHTGDSGISISQVQPPSTIFNPETTKLMNFRKPSAPKLKVGHRKLSNITVTPSYKSPLTEPKKEPQVNIPLSLSITKKDDQTKTDGKKDDSVEIITIE